MCVLVEVAAVPEPAHGSAVTDWAPRSQRTRRLRRLRRDDLKLQHFDRQDSWISGCVGGWVVTNSHCTGCVSVLLGLLACFFCYHFAFLTLRWSDRRVSPPSWHATHQHFFFSSFCCLAFHSKVLTRLAGLVSTSVCP
ncbi:hypothetical protein CONPUDRAFT_140232 [Coniophora puteana RWD-64-598 SS2]|uniref:Uncharacterized protein n=1 Tax=Coniophora puteana (strain RWD-64-598) TaxID=741705 RepID=A0A5M3M7C2_CONPW|nr:uncharacterized protein CONPUDRAFT_140232 [Coniophora puteana RWD-64-598 SS2]EIW74754.1 hypothetical protein CONPUDRAFT_140232 [Coniophora puteana RWD-64-598 SS2]